MMNRTGQHQCHQPYQPCVTRAVSATIAVAGALSSPPATSTAAAQECTLTQVDKLLPFEGRAGDRFGHAVAVDGDFAAIGAYRDDDACSPGSSCNSGSVYVYQRNGTAWQYMAELHPADLAPGDQFGRAVALSGNTLLVGSPLDDDFGSASGSAYVFVFDGTQWTQQDKLTAADAAGGDSFGDAVALDGDTAVIGCYLDDHAAGPNAGAAYVFDRSGTEWTQTTKLTAADSASADNFGNTVAIDGDTIVVGAENDDDPTAGRNAGSAYVFTRASSTWSQAAKLTADVPGMDDRFGWDVDVDGSRLIVNALEEDDHGAVYVFEGAGSAWASTARIVPDDVSTFDDFGHSIALAGDVILIGVPNDDDVCGGSPSCDAGAAYLYQNIGGVWSQLTKQIAADVQADDELGYAVALDGGTMVLGARMHSALAEDAGAAYMYQLDCVVSCEGDLDLNGRVDAFDIVALTDSWGGGPETGHDVNGDGVVNVFDLFVILNNWGPCPDGSRRVTVGPKKSRSHEPRGRALGYHAKREGRKVRELSK